MHRRGVYHGDLKPGNIMLAKNGQVKLIDFGTAWVRGQEKNRIQGTPNYIAPNRPRKRSSTRRRTSTTSARRCTACSPAGSPSRAYSSPGKTGSWFPRSKLNPRIPAALNELIVASLSLDPSKRPAGMFEMRDQLSAIAKQMGLAEVDLKGADEEE